MLGSGALADHAQYGHRAAVFRRPAGLADADEVPDGRNVDKNPGVDVHSDRVAPEDLVEGFRQPLLGRVRLGVASPPLARPWWVTRALPRPGHRRGRRARRPRGGGGGCRSGWFEGRSQPSPGLAGFAWGRRGRGVVGWPRDPLAGRSAPPPARGRSPREWPAAWSYEGRPIRARSWQCLVEASRRPARDRVVSFRPACGPNERFGRSRSAPLSEYIRNDITAEAVGRSQRPS